MKSVDYTAQIESRKSETEIKKEICDYVKRRGFRVYRMNAGSVKVRGGWMRLCDKNTPDNLFSVCGRFVWCEVKKKGLQATKEQAAHHEKLRADGHFVICADGMNDFIKQFDLIVKLIKAGK